MQKQICFSSQHAPVKNYINQSTDNNIRKETMKSCLVICLAVVTTIAPVVAFAPLVFQQQQQHRPTTNLHAEETEKAAPIITGEELERMLTEWDTPLVVDAYATWCGPCLLMAPEFEEAAKELKDRVRFAKLDTDKEEAMAARLNIMGLPTLLFLDKYEPKADEENQNARAVLKGRIEGALRKQNIIDLCEYYFFNGPEPKLF